MSKNKQEHRYITFCERLVPGALILHKQKNTLYLVVCRTYDVKEDYYHFTYVSEHGVTAHEYAHEEDVDYMIDEELCGQIEIIAP